MSVSTSRTLIDVAPFRERALEQVADGSASWSEMCVRLGWLRGGRRTSYNRPHAADTTRLKRTLGLSEGMSHGTYRGYRRHVSYDMALRLCDAMDLDPVDMDL